MVPGYDLCSQRTSIYGKSDINVSAACQTPITPVMSKCILLHMLRNIQLASFASSLRVPLTSLENQSMREGPCLWGDIATCFHAGGALQRPQGHSGRREQEPVSEGQERPAVPDQCAGVHHHGHEENRTAAGGGEERHPVCARGNPAGHAAGKQ